MQNLIDRINLISITQENMIDYHLLEFWKESNEISEGLSKHMIIIDGEDGTPDNLLRVYFDQIPSGEAKKELLNLIISTTNELLLTFK